MKNKIDTRNIKQKKKAKSNHAKKQAPTAKSCIPGRQGYHGCVPNYSGHLPRYPLTLLKSPSLDLLETNLHAVFDCDRASRWPLTIFHL